MGGGGSTTVGHVHGEEKGGAGGEEKDPRRLMTPKVSADYIKGPRDTFIQVDMTLN